MDLLCLYSNYTINEWRTKEERRKTKVLVFGRYRLDEKRGINKHRNRGIVFRILIEKLRRKKDTKKTD
jgi:hypothetical protein